MDFRYARPPESQQPPPQQPVPPPPGTWYTGQFQYQSPSPPPSHWAPHSDHHRPPPPPMPYPSSNYAVPPRPHMPPPPPPPHYPQEWSNQRWSHQGWDYSAHNKNEDDWAARAKAWAASKAVTDDQYQHQHSSSFALPPGQPANHLQDPASFGSGYGPDGYYSYPARDGNLRDPGAVYSRQETAPITVSAHQLEVPSSYSSVAGKEEPSDTNINFYQPQNMAFASANERSIPVEQPHYSFNSSAAESATDLSNQPLDFVPRYGHDPGPFGQSGVPGMPYSMPPVHTTIQQADPSLGVSSPASLHPTPFGRISSFQPTISSTNSTFPIGTSNSFHGDTYGTPGFPERPKKASVPSWLREEIIKKKAVIGTSAPEVSRQDTESNEDEIMDHKEDQKGEKNTASAWSTEMDDDKDDVEAARTAAVNQEIKRILTEVLLKVTDELFDEIATKVLEEDNLSLEVERKAENAPAVITPKPTAKVIIPAKTKGADVDDANGKSTSTSPGDLLGLGSYASDDDDDDEEKEVKNPSSNSSTPPVHLSENGSSQVDDLNARGKKLLEESDSHKVGPNGDKYSEEKVKLDGIDFSKSKPSVVESKTGPDKSDKDKKHTKVDENSRAHDDRHIKRAKQEDSHKVGPNGAIELLESRNDRSSGDKVKPDGFDFSKSKPSVVESKTGPDKSDENKKRTKVDENSRAHDDRHIKRAKREEQNGSKEKTKDQDSSRRFRDKEDGRKREREKDDKNERSKYKAGGGESSRHKRRRSPSPGGRGRSSKDNSSVSHARGSTDSSSDDSRRKVHSRRRDLSPSPVRSRRQVSRSPSRRSHRKQSQSNYSSLETTRERRRSRSRSRSRSRPRR